MRDMTALSQISARKFHAELSNVVEIKPSFSDCLNIFSQLVSARNYSDMIFNLGREKLTFLEVPVLTEVVDALNRKGAQTTQYRLAQALVESVGKTGASVFFPFIASATKHVENCDKQTLLTNFNDIGLFSTFKHGYKPIARHSFRDVQLEDANFFIHAFLSQDAEKVQGILDENSRVTTRFQNRITLDQIRLLHFSEFLAELLVLNAMSDLGDQFSINDVIHQFDERVEVEGFVTGALELGFRHQRHVSWDEGAGRMFVIALSESIHSELIYHLSEFRWDRENLETIIEYTKHFFMESLCV
ncbi:hypothetical protein AL538_13985 [Vibrio harveyi]|uniref:Uncharacterized protein n=1 Tax=Vibrio harveyi TaxID=669 RepID=A0ABN4L2Z2_VIBHA|nr:hypothetical protein [Vibrio harveyi]AMF98742.1 hypothetical protein AL538_13985 [Vibrio harveyi]